MALGHTSLQTLDQVKIVLWFCVINQSINQSWFLAWLK